MFTYKIYYSLICLLTKEIDHVPLERMATISRGSLFDSLMGNVKALTRHLLGWKIWYLSLKISMDLPINYLELWCKLGLSVYLCGTIENRLFHLGWDHLIYNRSLCLIAYDVLLQRTIFKKDVSIVNSLLTNVRFVVW